MACLSVDHQQKGPVHAETLAGGNGCQGHGEHLFQVNGTLQDRAQFVQEANFEGLAVKEADQGLDLGFLALMLIVDKAEYGGQRVAALTEAVQVTLELGRSHSIFPGCADAGKSADPLLPPVIFGQSPGCNDIPVPAAFPVHADSSLIVISVASVSERINVQVAIIQPWLLSSPGCNQLRWLLDVPGRSLGRIQQLDAPVPAA